MDIVLEFRGGRGGRALRILSLTRELCFRILEALWEEVGKRGKEGKTLVLGVEGLRGEVGILHYDERKGGFFTEGGNRRLIFLVVLPELDFVFFIKMGVLIFWF